MDVNVTFRMEGGHVHIVRRTPMQARAIADLCERVWTGGGRASININNGELLINPSQVASLHVTPVS